MSADPRLVLTRGGIAASALEGLVAAERFVDPRPMEAVAPVAALRASADPQAERISELLLGEAFDVIEERDGFAFGQAVRDGYVGYAPLEALGPRREPPTHRIIATSTYGLADPTVRAPDRGPLSLNSLVRVTREDERFLQAQGAGWIPRTHLAGIGEPFVEDPVDIAERLVGTPYRWGGRASAGLDCSGLVQQAFFAAGRACPRDSDQQALLGQAADPADLRRGDLVFWRGHVGLMASSEELIHANAHHMCVAREPFAVAVERIARAGGGEPTHFRRIGRPAAWFSVS